MDIEPYFTELNSLAKYGQAWLNIILPKREGVLSIIKSHSDEHIENIFVIHVSACGGFGLRQSRDKGGGNNPVCDMAS